MVYRMMAGFRTHAPLMMLQSLHRQPLGRRRYQKPGKPLLLGKIRKSPLSDQEAAAVTPVQVLAHSIDSGVNQKRHRRERRGQNRIMGSW